jgi:ribosomal protein S18 acetylase RimI-like enzyme
VIRRGGHGDVPFMRSMLAHAYNWRVNAFDAEIPLSRYVENWGRTGDVTLIATETGHRVGAAWFRLFRESAPGYAFVDERTPELTIAVVPSRRQHGVGRELMEELLRRAAAEGHEAISLSVEQDSPAVGFYERHGFERVGESAGAIVMRRPLP